MRQGTSSCNHPTDYISLKRRLQDLLYSGVGFTLPKLCLVTLMKRRCLKLICAPKLLIIVAYYSLLFSLVPLFFYKCTGIKWQRWRYQWNLVFKYSTEMSIPSFWSFKHAVCNKVHLFVLKVLIFCPFLCTELDFNLLVQLFVS